jgi:glycerophosphoryl diester phosphodiesterase
VDVGSFFSPQFRGEKLATLDDFCRESAGKIGLLIELKAPLAGEIPLARACVAAVRRAPPGLQARFCSQSLTALAEVARLMPEAPRGFIAGATLGDPTQLPVQFLMLESRLTTPTRALRARAAGLDLLAWTVNDPNLLAPLLDAGATGIITDDIPAMKQRLRELAALTPTERLLLRVRQSLIQP